MTPNAITIPRPQNETVYSPTGFFFLINSNNKDCTDPFASYGVPVNTCFVDNSYAYKFQLVAGIFHHLWRLLLSSFFFAHASKIYNTPLTQPFDTLLCITLHYIIRIVLDTCVGGIVQYFLDTHCNFLAGSTDLSPVANNCTLATNPIFSSKEETKVYDTLMCTTNEEPQVPMTSGVIL